MSDIRFTTVRNGEIELRVAISGSGPLILCVHGWPELWYSWRHQMRHFAAQGFTVAAMDVRGYGGSSKPTEIAAYSLRELTSRRGCRDRCTRRRRGDRVRARLGCTDRLEHRPALRLEGARRRRAERAVHAGRPRFVDRAVEGAVPRHVLLPAVFPGARRRRGRSQRRCGSESAQDLLRGAAATDTTPCSNRSRPIRRCSTA